jgi:phosphomannomutase
LADVRIASISGLRGVVGRGFDPACVAEFAAAYCAECPPGAILVGHDGRPTAEVFRHAVLSAVTGVGRNAFDCGAVATPTIGFLVPRKGAAGAIQISASHNPPEYNGLKMFQPGGMVLGPETGRRVLERVGARRFDWARWDAIGQVVPVSDPLSEHLESVLALVDVDEIRRRRFIVALDSSHGSGGILGMLLLKRLGCEIHPQGTVPDGRYEHPPEPIEENLAKFSEVVRSCSADVGFAQDPDADRLAIVDERGRYIGEEMTIVLAALRRLDTRLGTIVVNLSTSRMIDDVAASRGARVVRTPVGEIHVVEAMKLSGAVLGGEGNGGVIEPRVGFVRDSFVGMALVLDLLANRRLSLGDAVDALPRYAMIKRKYALGAVLLSEGFEMLEHRFAGAAADRRDGLRLDWSDRWVHVRGSNTEPIVRVIAEAPDGEAAARLAADVVAQLRLDAEG